MVETNSSGNLRYRVRRNASGFVATMQENWREKRWFRWAGYGLAGLILLWAVVWVLVLRSLPSADKLLTYQPPLPTMVRSIDGSIAYSYARERRVQLRFVDFPKQMTNAFLAAEDKTFWTHGGVDYTGLAGAVLDFVTKIGSDERAKGEVTIKDLVEGAKAAAAIKDNKEWREGRPAQVAVSEAQMVETVRAIIAPHGGE